LDKPSRKIQLRLSFLVIALLGRMGISLVLPVALRGSVNF
jgi:hypothetical protein